MPWTPAARYDTFSLDDNGLSTRSEALKRNQRRHAARLLAMNATSAAELAEWLAMAGLSAEEGKAEPCPEDEEAS